MNLDDCMCTIWCDILRRLDEQLGTELTDEAARFHWRRFRQEKGAAVLEMLQQATAGACTDKEKIEACCREIWDWCRAALVLDVVQTLAEREIAAGRMVRYYETGPDGKLQTWLMTAEMKKAGLKGGPDCN
jgi:hypothetical protein